MPNLVVLRRKMIEVGNRLSRQGLIVAAEGNLSVRLSGHSFLVTPSGAAKGDLHVQDLLEVGARGLSPAGRVTSEWPLHGAIYEARSDVGAICHAHSPWSTAFAVSGRDLDGSLLTETSGLLPRVPLAPRAVPGTPDLAASVLPSIAHHDAVLLGGHGVITVAADLDSACALLETVERLAQVTLLSELAAGHDRLSDEIWQRLLQGVPRPGSGSLSG